MSAYCTWLHKFYARTTKCGDCLIWNGYVNPDGYGKVRRNGVCERAHRALWKELKGEIPDKYVIMHSCDNRSCVNINHLSLGTQKQNIRDAIEKGRVPQLA